MTNHDKPSCWIFQKYPYTFGSRIFDNVSTLPILVFAYGRVNDPMAKLQFLRVGWGGMGWGGVGWGGVGWGWWHSLNLNTWWMLRNCPCLVIAHMVDATQLCLSCNCTHGGCYATVLVLPLHTWWMLRNCACLVIAHMVDATQLCLSCHCTHGGCYATEFVLSLHTWWMLRNCPCLVIAHMVVATQLSLSCHCTHGGCYATVLVF